MIRIETDTIAYVEHEVAVLVRLLTATRPHNPQVVSLDRSAYLILYEVLHHRGPMGLQDLADRLQVDLSTLSRQVSAMEAKGLLQRHDAPNDSRIHLVAATQEGMLRFAAMRTARRDVYTEILDDWSEADRQRLADQLERLNEAIRQYKRRTAHGNPA